MIGFRQTWCNPDAVMIIKTKSNQSSLHLRKLNQSLTPLLFKLLCLFSVILLVFSLSACGGGDSAPADTGDITAPDAPVITSPADGATINTGTPTISGTAEADSTVELFDTDGTTSLGTATVDASGNWSITTTTLANGAHSLTVKATDAAGNTSTTSTAINITVDIPAPTVNALYPAAPNWNDYVKTSDTTTACDGTETGGYSACMHGGEMRTVNVPGYSNCTDLSATDALGAFDWTCDASTNPVRMVSTGLRDTIAVTGTTDGTSANQLVNSTAGFVTDGVGTGDTVINTTDYTTATVASVDSQTQLTLADDIFISGESYSINIDKNLSDLLNFTTPGWKSNSVTVKDGVTTLFTTSSSVWWSNAVLASNGGSLTDVGSDGIGEIYIVTTDSGADYTIADDKIALVAKPNVTLTGSGGAGDVINAVMQNFLWIEAAIDATDDDTAVAWTTVKFSVIRNLDAINAGTTVKIGGISLYSLSINNSLSNITTISHSQYGLYLLQSGNNTLKNITATGNGSGGVGLNNNTSDNILINVTAANNTNTGVGFANSSNNNILSNITAVNNRNGLGFYTTSNDNSLSDIIASNNSNYGVYLDASSNNILSNINASNNGHEGVSLARSSNNNNLSNVIADNNVDNGVYLDTSSNNNLSNITASDNAWYGVSLTWGSNNNDLSNVTAINNGEYGVYLSSSTNNTLSNIEVVNSLYGVYFSSASDNRLTNIAATENEQGVYLSSSSNNSFSNMTTTNNGTAGIYLSGSSSNNSLSNITTSNNWLYGILLQGYSNNNSLSNISAINNYIGVYLHNLSSNNSLSNISAANNTNYGVLIQVS